MSLPASFEKVDGAAVSKSKVISENSRVLSFSYLFLWAPSPRDCFFVSSEGFRFLS